MIIVLHGEDDFSKRESLEGLRQDTGPPELLEANTTTLAGAGLSREHLQEVCSVVPFLAEHRLIIVDGLLGRLDDVRVDRRQGRSSRTKDALEEWQGLAETLAQLPASTILVFLEGVLRRDNALLKDMASIAQVQAFPPLSGEALEQWVRQRVAGVGATITNQAARRLMDLVGGNLWALSGEIEKLALYAGDKAIGEEAVALLVAHTRETSIFRAVDAILGGQPSSALQLISWLRQSGAEVSYIITMLARQLRLILLAHELLGQRLPRADLGRRMGLTVEFALRQTEAQARRHAPGRVVAMYRQLMETDLAIKRGELSEDLALETLVAGLSQISSDLALRPTGSGSR